MINKDLEDRRGEFTRQLSIILNEFMAAKASRDTNKINAAKVKVDKYLLQEDAGKFLDVESKTLLENLKQYFLDISNDEKPYKVFADILVQVFSSYKKEDIDDHKCRKPKAILLFQDIVDTYFPSIKTDALYPDTNKPWQKDLLKMLTRDLGFDEYKSLPLKYQDELFPRGRLVANHLFDFSFTHYEQVKHRLQQENEKAQAELLKAVENITATHYSSGAAVAVEPAPAPKVSMASAAFGKAAEYLRRIKDSQSQGSAVQDL